jgi:hypothetical protein
MATTRAFAYNPSLNPIPGTDSYGTLVIGTSNLDFSKDYGGIKWWMGPDETLGYVIGGVVSGGTQPSPVGDIGTVEFWRTDSLTTNEFILLANQISGQYFTNTSDAITWLNNNGYWTSYDPLLATLTPTPSVTPMATPLVTMTPTVTMTPSRAISGPLLDEYPGAAVAYSLRRISSSYNGSAIRVRRSSDNSEQDIGFLNNGLDTTTLTSFVGSGNGFVTTWYDQSGNGKTAVQSTSSRQPRIVNNGTIEYKGVRPIMRFTDGSFSSFITNQNVRGDGYLSTFFVAGINSVITGVNRNIFTIGPVEFSNNLSITMWSATNAFGWIGGDPTAWGKGIIQTASVPYIVVSGSPYTNPVESSSVSSVFLGSSGTGYYVNGINRQTRILSDGNNDTTNIANKLTIGSVTAGGSSDFSGFMCEVVMYDSNKNTDRTGIENNINGYYLIY